MVSEIKQVAGYESIVLILLLVMWASYRFWKSTKSGELAAEMEEDDDIPEEYTPVSEPVRAQPEAFLDTESLIYNDKPSSTLSASIKGKLIEIPDVPGPDNSELSDFDARKAVIWSEVLKRPYC